MTDVEIGVEMAAKPARMPIDKSRLLNSTGFLRRTHVWTRQSGRLGRRAVSTKTRGCWTIDSMHNSSTQCSLV